MSAVGDSSSTFWFRKAAPTVARWCIRRLLMVSVGFAVPLAACGEPNEFVSEGDQRSSEDVSLKDARALAWGPCPTFPGVPDVGQECADLSVPLDYRAKGKTQLSVAISRVRASNPEQRRGVLLLNPGGPGGEGRVLAPLFALVLPEAIRERYDLVGFDPRGVGGSSPVTCDLTPDQVLNALLPVAQPSGFQATAEYEKAVAKQCQDHAGRVLPFLTTANTARDMDRIRQALGETKISYYGVSYGTFLGATYASLFPSRTDRFVLDSSVNPRAVWREQFRVGAAADVRLPDFLAFAVANADTFHLGQTNAEVRQTLFQVIERLNRRPIAIPGSIVLTGELVRLSMFNALYSDQDFPLMAEMARILAAPQVDIDALKALASPSEPEMPGVPADNGTAAALAVLCDDVNWSRAPEQYQRELILDRARSPLFGAVGSNIYPCAYWATQAIEAPVTINAKGPRNILLLQNLRDPITPIWGASELRRELGGRAQMVSVDAGGHGVYLAIDNNCATSATETFLVSGTLPTGDVSCPAEAQVAQSNLRLAKITADDDAPQQRQKVLRQLRKRLR